MAAEKIIKALMARGHSAFLVGGCVRDLILGQRPVDFDLATSADTAEIIATAEENCWKTILTGKAFGVVTIIIDGYKYETASFRTDVYGDDSHRPAFVKPVNSIYADLARRDFTINAMAMDINGNIIDLFGGTSDLKKKIVRAVGNAGQRFAEDGLRMFRAVSFAARFDFEIEPDTFSAIFQNLNRVRGLSAERVLAEIEKILLSDSPVKGIELLIETGLAYETCRTRFEEGEHQVNILPELKCLKKTMPDSALNGNRNWEKFLEKTPKNIVLRWVALLYSITEGMSAGSEKNYCPKDAEEEVFYHFDEKKIEKVLSILNRLKVRPKEVNIINWLVKNHLRFPENETASVVEWLGEISKSFSNYDQMRKALVYLLLLAKSDYRAGADNPRLLVNTINRALKCFVFFPEQLAISGKEIAAKLGQGRQVGQFQRKMIVGIQRRLLKNTVVELLKALKREKIVGKENFL